MAYKLLKQKYGKDITGIIMDYYEDDETKKNQFLGVIFARYNARIERRKSMTEFMILDESEYLFKRIYFTFYGDQISMVRQQKKYKEINFTAHFFDNFIITPINWNKKLYAMYFVKQNTKQLQEITKYEDCKRLFFEILFNNNVMIPL